MSMLACRLYGASTAVWAGAAGLVVGTCVRLQLGPTYRTMPHNSNVTYIITAQCIFFYFMKSHAILFQTILPMSNGEKQKQKTITDVAPIKC